MADVESLELQITGNATGAEKSLDALIKTLDRLKTATSGGCGLSAVANGLQQVNNSGKGASTSNSKTAMSFAKLGTKIVAAVHTLKKGGDVVASWIKESNDYIENANLFTVAMGEYADSAKQYAEEVGNLMGIDPSDWMRSQGVFMTMATGFGVAEDRAATLSQQLTQLGYDLSSFYNIDVTEAMTKLRSGLAGELEPLRSLGYDLSKAKLEATALSLGIDKTVDSMTQAEKAELRYYAIMNQVTTVQGDMARTLNAPANQMRVLSAQATQAARALGDLFIPALNAILPVGIAVLKVITALAKIIARLFGADVSKENISDEMGNLASSAGSAGSEIDNATNSAKKLKKMLLGIDELNVMSDASGGSGTDSYGGGGFDFELPTYDFLGDLAESRVAQIVEDMKEWLGITDDIDTWAELMDTRFGNILKTVGLIGVSLLAWKLTKGFIDGIAALKELLASPYYSIAIGAILTITGFTLSFSGMEDAVKRGLDGFNFAEIIGGDLLAAGGAAILGSKLATWISTAFAGSAVDLAITQAGINLGVGTAGAAGAALLAGFAAIIVGIPTFFVGIYDALNDGIDWLSGLLIPAGATAAGTGIGIIIGACGGPIGAGIGALIGLAIGLVTDGIILITQKGEEIVQWFDGVRTKFDGWASNLRGKISNFFAGIVGETSSFSPKITKFFEDMGIDVLYVFDNIKLKIDRFLTNCRNMVDVLHKLFNGDFAGAWESLKGLFSDMFKSLGNECVIFVNGMISKFEALVNYFVRGINRIISGINKIAFDVPDWVPGVGGKSVGFNIKSVSEISLGRVPAFENGGFPATGQMFVAREAGPEIVGSIGRRTAVVNNDQIVESVSRGVYQAVVSAMSQSGGTQVVEAKVNDKVLFEVVVDRNRRETMRTGASPLLGGV